MTIRAIPPGAAAGSLAPNEARFTTQLGGNIRKVKALLSQVRRLSFEQGLDVRVLCLKKGSWIFGDNCLYDLSVTGPQEAVRAVMEFVQSKNGA